MILLITDRPYLAAWAKPLRVGMHWMRIAGATILAAATGFLIHVTYGQGISIEYIQKAAEGGRLDNVIRQPYPNEIVVIALLVPDKLYLSNA